MIEEARHRLEVLHADTLGEEHRDVRRITAAERTSIRIVLDELHRLNVAVSEQRKRLETLLTARERPATKPVARPKQKGSIRAPWLVCDTTAAHNTKPIQRVSPVMALSNARLDGKKPPRRRASARKGSIRTAAALVLLMFATTYFIGLLVGERVHAQGDYQAVTVSPGQYVHITTAAATPVKATSGTLKLLTVTSEQTGTVSVFDLDGASCTGTPTTNVVAVLTVSSSGSGNWMALPFNAALVNGICVKASVTAMDLTAVYQ